ncbi:hypothetical protein HMPREF9141_2734 [Prevotella multiformis DSM 16608]|uniref:Uncharacterized protein n=1 Tax=Prevotella multiformis DSM 16608 TaxID=888743 RepID=F0FAW7_9BACT|nr:hypothetical protein HMPREF9141_2734 [Prevotella multiformis DSM 16608]
MLADGQTIESFADDLAYGGAEDCIMRKRRFFYCPLRSLKATLPGKIQRRPFQNMKTGFGMVFFIWDFLKLLWIQSHVDDGAARLLSD